MLLSCLVLSHKIWFYNHFLDVFFFKRERVIIGMNISRVSLFPLSDLNILRSIPLKSFFELSVKGKNAGHFGYNDY